MLVKEEKELLKKMTVAVGFLLEKANKRYTDREIAEISKVSTNRLTEYKNYEKYGRSITMDNIVKLLFGGFFTMEEAVAVAEKVTDGLTEAERKHLKGMNVFGVSSFRKKVIQNEQLGLDHIESQTLQGDLLRSGIDPIELMKKALKG